MARPPTSFNPYQSRVVDFLGASLRPSGRSHDRDHGSLYPCDLTDAEWALAGAAVASASTAWPPALLAAAAPRQRAFLCPTHGLRLALSAAGVSTMANGLYDI